jgi:hypothetical protein
LSSLFFTPSDVTQARVMSHLAPAGTPSSFLVLYFKGKSKLKKRQSPHAPPNQNKRHFIFGRLIMAFRTNHSFKTIKFRKRIYIYIYIFHPLKIFFIHRVYTSHGHYIYKKFLFFSPQNLLKFISKVIPCVLL